MHEERSNILDLPYGYIEPNLHVPRTLSLPILFISNANKTIFKMTSTFSNLNPYH